MNFIKHQYTITRDIRKDGDIDAMVIQIPDTGDSSVVATDRYRCTIVHGLGRVPVGCIIQMTNKPCEVAVLGCNVNMIYIQFTAEHAQVNIRIW